MTHEQAAALVSDWIRGELESDRAALVERHVSGCGECQEAAEAVRSLVKEAGRLRLAAVPHPPADTLARYVTAPAEEPVASLATVAIHLQGCEPCRDDVALMREASTPGWWRPLRARLASAPLLPRPLQPAFAALLVVLVVPAWIGIVDAPRRVRGAEEARARAEKQVSEIASRANEAPRGGGVATLVLRATRSVEDRPALQLRAGQTLQPLLLDVTPPAGSLRVRIVGEGGAVTWSADGPREEFWDEANQLVGLLVPAASLSAGDYRVELTSEAARVEAPFFAAGFRVLPGPIQ